MASPATPAARTGAVRLPPPPGTNQLKQRRFELGLPERGVQGIHRLGDVRGECVDSQPDGALGADTATLETKWTGDQSQYQGQLIGPFGRLRTQLTARCRPSMASVV